MSTRTQVSLIVERMVKADMVRKIRDLRDRRSVRLVITREGEKVLDKRTVDGWELVQEILSPLSEEEMRTLIGMLERVRENAFACLNPEETMEEIRRNESRNMARFMKRVRKYGSGPALATGDQSDQMSA